MTHRLRRSLNRGPRGATQRIAVFMAAAISLSFVASGCSGEPTAEEELLERAHESTTMTDDQVNEVGKLVCQFRSAGMDADEIFYQIAKYFGPGPADAQSLDMRKGPAHGFTNNAIRAYCPDEDFV